ncbi:MAG: hypothetical protein ACTSP0_08910 [Alphaproteobacteria bacterium]
MMTLQNLDVHGTFDARQVRLKYSFYINVLAIKIFIFTALTGAGSSDESDRYRSVLHSKLPPEHALPPFMAGLFISEGSSTACQQEEPQ